MKVVGMFRALLSAAIVLLPAAWAGAGGPISFQTPYDNIPNFARDQTIQSVANGPWSSPATWTPARVPLASDVVQVLHTVTYDSMTGDADVVGIDAGAMLRFSTAQSTRLRVGVLLVMPGGTLEVGTAASPVPAALTAEIIIKNRPLNPASDPDQYGTGLLSVDGTVRLHGAIKSPTFVRLASAPNVGNSTFSLAQAVAGWRVDEAGIPYFVGEFEENMTTFDHMEIQLETFLENILFS